MGDHETSTSESSEPPRIPRRLDKLVASGRISAEEAERLGSAGGPEDQEAAVTAIRVRHAAGALEIAVESGRLGAGEATAILERIRSGEHSPELRARIRRLAQAEASGEAGSEDGDSFEGRSA